MYSRHLLPVSVLFFQWNYLHRAIHALLPEPDDRVVLGVPPVNEAGQVEAGVHCGDHGPVEGVVVTERI